jgi:hypothetical protein
MREACANRKSPVKIATELLHRELTDGWPRRTSASSMTSSWNSVARWVSSMATAAWMTRGSFGSPNCGQQDQQGPEPLAARRDGMPGGLGKELVTGMRRLHERRLDPGQIVKNLRRQGGVREIYRNCGNHTLSRSSARANASNSRVCLI